MRVRQYYYTSYVNSRTGTGGFQVKAMSPGTSAELQRMIARLSAYRVPLELAVDAIEQHPVALRYHYEGPGECILLCSRSCGNDEFGRPGNFFAHAVALEMDGEESIFTRVPPAFFWRSPFWRASDPEERVEIASLLALAAFEVPPSLDIEEIWRFLAEGRQELLYRLLCAVVHSSATRRRIIILDTCDHVALWVAAVSYLLPPLYRPLLTFATYHHDPYRAHYLITGVSSDPSFRASPDDEQAYFILNGEMGSASPVAASPYAELAAEAAQPDRYKSVLDPVFTVYASRFPRPTVIDEQLDRLALYTRIQRGAAPSNALAPEALEAVVVALRSFEQGSRDYNGEECAELKRIERSLRETMRIGDTPGLYATYRRALALLRAAHEPVDELLLEELNFFMEQFFDAPSNSSDRVSALDIETLRRLYGEKSLLAAMQNSAYLHWLAQRVQGATHDQARAVWKQVGTYVLRPGIALPAALEEQLIAAAFQAIAPARVSPQEIALYEAYRDHPALPGESRDIMEGVRALMHGEMTAERCEQLQRCTAFLPVEEYMAMIERYLPAFFSHHIPHEAHYHLIQALFPRGMQLMVADRFWRVYMDTLMEMLQRPSEVERAVAMVDFWFELAPPAFAEGYPVHQFFLLLAGDEQLREYRRAKQPLRAFNALASARSWYPSVQPLFGERKLFFFVPGWQRASGSRYGDQGWEEQRTVQMEAVLPHRKEMQRLKDEVGRIFAEGEIIEQHRQCARLYEGLAPAQFWQYYRKHFSHWLMTADAGQALSVFSFWFDLAPAILGQVRYIVQEFFLGLPSILEEARKRRRFRATMLVMRERVLATESGGYSWYPIIARYGER